MASTYCIHRAFRNMDDDGSRTLNFDEFKKGIQDYGLNMEDDVSTLGLDPRVQGVCTPSWGW